MNREIAVIGMACVFPRAADLAQFWENNVNAVDSITDIPAERWPDTDFSQLPETHELWIPCTRGGFIPAEAHVDARKFGVMPQALQNGDPDQFIMLALNQQALDDANVREDDPIRRRTDVIIGRGGYTSLKMSENCLRADLVARVMPVLRRSLPHLGENELTSIEQRLRSTLPACDPEGIISAIPNLVASRVSNRLNLLGAAYVVDAACASSLVAVEQAVERLRNRQCDLALASGIHLCQNPAFWMVFAQLRAISIAGVVRPFDRRADGLLLGEGAGVVVLKRLDDAQRDGDRVYAVIKGVGAASDGRVTGLLAPASSGQVEALQRAYADAQLDPASISYLEAHGTATIAGDAVEIATINTVFGESRFPTRVLGSVKSLIGHAMPAAGMAALIRTVMALAHKIFPPTLHCEEPRAELQHSSFYLTSDARPWIHPVEAGPRRAGVSAFGFGGINTHVVLEEVAEHHAAAITPYARPFWDARNRPSEPLLFSASTRQQLAQQIQNLLPQLRAESTKCRLEDVAFTLVHTLDANQPCKLAVVCRDKAEAHQLLQCVCEQLTHGEDPSNDSRVFFAADASQPKGKLAFVFPGMAFPGFGGEFPQHLMEMCLHFPELRTVLDRLENKDADPNDPAPLSHLFAPPETLSQETREAFKARLAPASPRGTLPRGVTLHQAEDRNLAALAVLVSNDLSARLLAQLDLRPDLACGQSLGELSALCEAGASNLYENLAPHLWAQATAGTGEFVNSKLAYVATSAETVSTFLNQTNDCAVAVDLAPQMVIVGGPDSAIDRLVIELREAGIVATGAPFAAAHTAQMSRARNNIEPTVESQAAMFKPPRIPVYSSITAEPFPDDPQAIVKLLAANFDQPVRAWQTIRRLYDDGARVILWAGCGAPSSYWDDEDSRSQVVISAVDLEESPPITQLNRLIASVFTAGVRFKPQAIYRHRKPQLMEPPAPSAHADERTWIRFRWPFSVPEVFPLLGATAPQSVVSVCPDVAPDLAFPPDNSASQGAALNAAEISTRDERDGHPSPLPFAGELLEFTPRQSIVLRRVLDLDEDLYLQDHCFINAAPYKPVEDCMPVFPLVMMIEAMAEASACLAPGLGLVALRNVRADRWINLLQRRRSELQIEAVVTAWDEDSGQCTVEAKILHQGEPSASATVVLGSAYACDLAWEFAELESAGPWPISADDLYRERYTFHGPRFRTVSRLESIGDNGLTGALQVLPKDELFASLRDPQLLIDPAVIDGAGQLLGAWAQAYGAYVLPTSIDYVEFCRAAAPPGTEVHLRLEIVRFVPDREVAANMEISDGEGRAWMRLAGWRDQVVSDSPHVMDMQREPQHRMLSTIENMPGVPEDVTLASVSESDLGTGGFNWLAHLYLTSDEIAASRSMVGQRPSQYILGRIAAKDAVRFWLAQRSGGEMAHPALIAIDTDSNGRPVVRPIAGFATMPQISIAHTTGVALAAASSQIVGVDLELASLPSADLLAEFATPDEVALLPSFDERDNDPTWPMRLWCAKETVGKAVGTGLAGTPGNFQLAQADADGRMIIVYRPLSQVWTVATELRHGLIRAVGLAAPAVSVADATRNLGMSVGMASPSE
jgi:acyl transferase domain-containing protein/phosphopantetheinyl transferase